MPAISIFADPRPRTREEESMLYERYLLDTNAERRAVEQKPFHVRLAERVRVLLSP